MSFKQINRRFGGAINAQDLKGTTGFLVGMRRNVGKYKSNIYVLEDDKTGETFEVWGNASIDANLTENGKGMKLDPMFMHRLVRFTFTGARKIKGRSQRMKEVKVEVDLASSRKGKTYNIKKDSQKA